MTGLLFACLVIATVDGDSFRCEGGLSVRAWGINSVERGEPGYREARLHLQGLILRKLLLCEGKGVSHDRIVARCRREEDGLDLGEAQVRAGHASDCPRFSGGLYGSVEPPGRARAAFCEPKP